MRNFSTISIFLALFVFLFGCQEKTKVLAPQDQQVMLQVNLEGLNSVGDSAQYVLWAINNNSTTEETWPLGHFTVDSAGKYSANSFDVKLGVIQQATSIVVSVEPLDSIPPEPSRYRIIAGKLKANHATFSVGDDYLLSTDLSKLTASYQLLKAPNSDALEGIWFVTGDTLKAAGLDLPDAISGWKYQAFVIKGSQMLDIGSFTKVSGADRQNLYGDPANPMTSYPFPGENFQVDTSGAALNIDLRGAEVVVQIVPLFPAGVVPFTLDIFKGTIPADASAGVTYQLENNSETFPDGNATLIIKLYD